MGAYCVMAELESQTSSEPSGPAPENQAAGPAQPGSQNLNPSSAMQPTPTDNSVPQSSSQQRLPLWLQQAERLLRVIVRIYLGVLVCLAPWFPVAWEGNPLFTYSPSMVAFVSHGWLRGLVSGLGLLNLWIALRDAVRGPADPGSR